MRVQLIARTKGLSDVCAEAAAVCTNSVNAASALRGALSCGHESVIEHASFTFRITGISRVTLAQLTRHRIASFSVQSQRYCGLTSFDVVKPPMLKAELADKYCKACLGAIEVYNDLVKQGVPEEDARYVLPQSVMTDLIMTMNARELGHFLSLRMCNRAQWEIRELADKIWRIVQHEAPEIFRHCGPGCIRGRCPQGKRSCGHPRTMELSDAKEPV